ncbi:MAG: TIR domain-containing protein [Ktedonobacteraceae bacterium]
MRDDTISSIEVFISYAHEDERFRKKLETHLGLLRQQGLITTWHDRKISAGTEWANEISTHLDTAQIILLLISPPFLASTYCYSSEMKRALERHEDGTARVIPIILRSVHWKGAPFSGLQALPTDARPVAGRGWHNQDEALGNVVEGIREAIEEWKDQRRVQEIALAQRAWKPQVNAAGKVVLLEEIIKYFNLEDLKVLCAYVERALARDGIEIQVNLDMVGGDGMQIRVLNLIEYLERRGYLAYLVSAVRLNRPGVL